MKWNELDYWQSGEWQVVEERLNDLAKAGVCYCPGKASLFRALRATPFEEVTVAILGQDPYPNPSHATGIAFSVPPDTKRESFPPTLQSILREYREDLHYPSPQTGDLTPWCKQGVLLWNVIPSCLAWKSQSHNWTEWTYLTNEIIQKLNERNVVIAALGSIARSYVKSISSNDVIVTSHPSPRGNLNSRSPFNGSRLFTTINSHLVNRHFDPINWRLP